jgi:uracil-DNA glycosylase
MTSPDLSASITASVKYLINPCDCISIGNKGDEWTQAVFKKYPYSNCYQTRTTQSQRVTPGSLQIKGDGKQQKFVINLFVSYYPGEPKYPNDNQTKRAEWFKNALQQLLEIPELVSLAFPPHYGGNHEDRYLSLISDFRKMYYLRHKVQLTMIDYQGVPIIFQTSTQTENLAPPIQILKTSDDSTEDEESDEVDLNLNVVRTVTLQNLIYTLTPAPVTVPKQLTISAPKLAKNFLADVTDDDISGSIQAPTKKIISLTMKPKPKPEPVAPPEGEQKTQRVYDCNPDWKTTISELISDVDETWEPVFKTPRMMAILSQLDKDLEKEMEGFGDHMPIFPTPQALIFEAFRKTSFPPKVVILGQDPYHANATEAMGMAFSVPDQTKIPPSLVNIFKELQTDITGFVTPKTGNLTKWAEQGVLLLNTALTVRQGQPESHLKFWLAFSDEVISKISELSSPIFMLWGAKAKAKKKLIKGVVLEASHPSPMSANSGGWFGSKNFSQANTHLIKNKQTPIKW